jgi:carboxypeptidase T
MRMTCLGLSILCGLTSFAIQAKSDAREVLRVHTTERAEIQRLAGRYGHLMVSPEKGIVVFDAPAWERDRLRAEGFDLEVDALATEALQNQPAMLPSQKAGIPGYTCYRTVTETYARIDQLAAQHPDLASIIDIGDSWEKSALGGSNGADVRVLKITNSAVAGPKPILFVMTAIHAREYTTAELNLRFAEYLLDRYGSDADATWVLDHHEVHLLIQSNPDGRRKAETGLSWRKNTNQGYCGTTSNSRGADLNRNWPFKWGQVAGGSSGSAV